MKTILLSLLFCCTASAQIAVQFVSDLSTNDQRRVAGWSTNYITDQAYIGTNSLPSGYSKNWSSAQVSSWIASHASDWAATSLIQSTNAAFRLASLKAACDAVAQDVGFLTNPNYGFVTNWPNLQLGLMYMNTNLNHLATVVSNMSAAFQLLYQQTQQ
jgi:hypothetical protein